MPVTSPRPPSHFRPGLDQELDAILLKALAGDPERRYQSAAALAEDLERYLAGRPVLAHPPSNWHLLRKLVRRHRWWFGGADPPAAHGEAEQELQSS